MSTGIHLYGGLPDLYNSRESQQSLAHDSETLPPLVVIVVSEGAT